MILVGQLWHIQVISIINFVIIAVGGDNYVVQLNIFRRIINETH